MIDAVLQDEGSIQLEVLSKILPQYSSFLSSIDFNDLLALLVQKQPKIQTLKQMRAFTDIGDYLLRTKFNESSSNDQWHKISQLALKNSSENNVIAKQSLRLMQLLIKQGVIVSSTFIVSIIKDITSNLIDKSDETIHLMIAILKTPSINSIESSNELKINIVKWLHETSSKNNELFSECLIGESYVLCCLMNISNVQKINLNSVNELSKRPNSHLSMVNKLKKINSRQSLTKLMIVQHDHDETKQLTDRLPESSQIIATINEKVIEVLEINLSSCMTTMDESIPQLICGLTIIINTLNQFLLYESFDENKFQKSYFLKILNLLNQKLNEKMQSNTPSSLNEAHEILLKLEKIYNVPLHPTVLRLIFGDQNTGHILQWIQNCLSTRSQSDSPTTRIIDELGNTREKVDLLALILASRFANFGEEYIFEKALSSLTNYEWNYSSNEHIFMLDKIIKTILMESNQSEQTIQFAYRQMMILFKQYFNTSQSHAEMIFRNVPDIIRCLRNMDDERVILTKVLSFYLKKAYDMHYDSHLTSQVNVIIKYLAKYYSHYECLDSAIYPLENFIRIDDFEVQMAAVECLSFIFDHSKYDQIESSKLNEIHCDLMNSLKLEEFIYSDDEHLDRKHNTTNVRIQIYCAIIGTCSCLRQIGWWQFIHFTSYVANINKGLNISTLFRIALNI